MYKPGSLLQFGRAGRSGAPAVCVLLRRTGERTPKEMKEYLMADSGMCLKKGLVKIFSPTNPDGGYFTIRKVNSYDIKCVTC